MVLPHPALLMPTLHHLPRKDVNISLGYPLDRSLLARLADTVFRVRESRRPDGRTHLLPLDLIRHPYVRMLRLPPGNDGRTPHGKPLRPLLRLLEERLRSGRRLVDPAALTADLLDEVLGDLDGRGSGGPGRTDDEGCDEAFGPGPGTRHERVGGKLGKSGHPARGRRRSGRPVRSAADLRPPYLASLSPGRGAVCSGLCSGLFPTWPTTLWPTTRCPPTLCLP